MAKVIMQQNSVSIILLLFVILIISKVTDFWVSIIGVAPPLPLEL